MLEFSKPDLMAALYRGLYDRRMNLRHYVLGYELPAPADDLYWARPFDAPDRFVTKFVCSTIGGYSFSVLYDYLEEGISSWGEWEGIKLDPNQLLQYCADTLRFIWQYHHPDADLAKSVVRSSIRQMRAHGVVEIDEDDWTFLDR